MAAARVGERSVVAGEIAATRAWSMALELADVGALFDGVWKPAMEAREPSAANGLVHSGPPSQP